jgi:hypothetical protein
MEKRCGGGGRDDTATIVHEEVDRLPDRYRMPIVLCDLQGHSCEETARRLGCPIGTVGSRLARGRERLRRQLVRRGLSPAAGTLGTILANDSTGATLPPSLAQSTVSLAVQFATGVLPAGATSVSAVELARGLSRSFLLTKIRLFAAGFIGIAGMSLVTGWTFQAIAGLQPPPAQRDEKPKANAAFSPNAAGDPPPEKKPADDSGLGTIGNMRPLIEDAKGVRFQSREAALKKDGTVTVKNLETQQPVGPPLRHRRPIREVAFNDEAKLLITTSDESVKLWDGLTGELRREIDGQVMRPLFFTEQSGAKQFATIDLGGHVVTTWDATTLEPVGTLRPEGVQELLGAGLSLDGKTLATIEADHSVTLWDTAANQRYATLRPPSRVINRVFLDQVQLWTPPCPTVSLDRRFWEIVQPLQPARAVPARR